MFDFHEKRKIRSILYSVPVIVVVFTISILIFLSVRERFTIEREMAEKLSEREAELQELQARAETLEANVAHLKDERGIEEEIRNRFDVAKEGEKVIIIVDNEPKEKASATPITEGSAEAPDGSFFDVLKFW